jgi:hypothetical protein
MMTMDEASEAYFAEQSARVLEDFRVAKIARPLEEIPIAIYNRIQRELRSSLGEPLFLFLELMIRVSGDTWSAVRFLGSNKLEHGRQVEFLYAVPPLTRTVLDSLLTVIFMFDDPSVNVRRYYAGAWRDRYEKHQELVVEHGSDLAWRTRLDVEEADIAQIHKLAGITQAEKDAVDQKLPQQLIKYWPNPGKFGRSNQVRDKKREDFLRHVNDWFYGTLSQDSHLSFTGLERRGGMYAQTARGFDVQKHHDYSRSTFMADFLAIYTALLSEVSCQLGLEHEKTRLRDEVWPGVDGLDPAELYKARYEEWLR